MKFLIAAAFLLASAFSALAQQNVGRYGVTICIAGGVADACAPIYAIPTGAYTVKYTGSLQPPRNSQTANTDDNSILDCGPNNTAAVTITLPTSSSTVFPPGHGVGVKNSGTNFICTVTVASAPNTSIYGAGGIVNGTPAAVGGPIAIFPGGEAYFTTDKSNRWLVSGFVPGVWYQFANNTPALQWTGLSGYPEYDLHCSGLMPVTSKDVTLLQIAYNGTFQSSGYIWTAMATFVGATAPSVNDSTTTGPSTAISVTNGVDTTSDFSSGAGATIDVHLAFADGTGAGFRRNIMATASFRLNTVEILWNNYGIAPPDITGRSITGIQIFNGSTGSNLRTGLCWLKPSL